MLGERFAEMRHMEHQLVRIDDTALLFIEDTTFAEGLRRQRDEHERHAEELESLVRSSGQGWPPIPDDFRRHSAEHLRNVAESVDTLDTARQVLAAELDLAERYESSARSEQLSAEEANLVQAHLDEERRHIDELERFVAGEAIRGQGHGGGAYNDTGDEIGTGPGVGGRGAHR